MSEFDVLFQLIDTNPEYNNQLTSFLNRLNGVQKNSGSSLSLLTATMITMVAINSTTSETAFAASSAASNKTQAVQIAQGPSRANALIKVLDGESGVALSGVRIRGLADNIMGQTDALGHFKSVAPISETITIEKNGYRSFTIDSSQLTALNIIQLDPLSTPVLTTPVAPVIPKVVPPIVPVSQIKTLKISTPAVVLPPVKRLDTILPKLTERKPLLKPMIKPVSVQQPVTSSATTVVVKAGDTLGALSYRYLGSYSRWKELLDLNKHQLASPAALQVGMVLRLSEIAEQTKLIHNDRMGPPFKKTLVIKPLVQKVEQIVTSTTTTNVSRPLYTNKPKLQTSYIVQSGDTLFGIARKLLGTQAKWQSLYQLKTKTLKNQDTLVVGQILRLPV
jgi:nucleoid-associated protein YgaU